MSTPSIARLTLSAIEAILPEVRALYVLAGPNGIMSFEIIIGELGGLDSLCAARVTASEYENHRRALEACHVASEIPAARSGK